MLSAVIAARLGYPAVLLAEQLAHQRSVHPGPLVLGAAPLKSLTPTVDRDRTVSRILFHCFQWYRLYLHPSEEWKEAACDSDKDLSIRRNHYLVPHTRNSVVTGTEEVCTAFLVRRTARQFVPIVALLEQERTISTLCQLHFDECLC